MTDERMKELMAQVGHPQSRSIAQLILQVENETAQHWQKTTATKCLDIVFGTIDESRARIAEQFNLDVAE